MRSGRGCEEGEHYRLPAPDRPSDCLEPPPPRRSAQARPREPFPQALWVELRQRLPKTAAPGRFWGQERRPLTSDNSFRWPLCRVGRSPREMKLLGRELGLFPRRTHPTRSRTLLGEGPPGVKDRGKEFNKTLSGNKPLSRSSLNVSLLICEMGRTCELSGNWQRPTQCARVCVCACVCVCVRARARACVYTQGERMGEGPRIVQMVASRGYLEQLPT